jgi:hypothetical protein
MSVRKDLAKMAREYRRSGWVITKGRKHTKWTSPDGQTIFVPSTPSDQRALLNIQAQINRALRVHNACAI